MKIWGQSISWKRKDFNLAGSQDKKGKCALAGLAKWIVHWPTD